MTDDERSRVAVLAVDGGNSKTDILLVGPDGAVLASRTGPTTSHQQVGLDAGTARLIDLVGDAARRDGHALALPARVGAYALAGADSPGDVRRLQDAIGRQGLATATIVVNDAFAPVRAGSDRGWGVGVICGAGVNAAGIAPDGRRARLAALGGISGDWGGGGDIGMAALGAAVRARDGRGPRTRLETAVPAHFDRSRPLDVTDAIEHGRLDESRLRELAPVVFATAATGDAVARGILDRMADEVVVMAAAIIRRLHLTRLDVDVTLAGGVFRADDPVFEARIVEGVRAVAPAARVRRSEAPPVLGAALLGLDELRRLGELTEAAHGAAVARLRRERFGGA